MLIELLIMATDANPTMIISCDKCNKDIVVSNESIVLIDYSKRIRLCRVCKFWFNFKTTKQKFKLLEKLWNKKKYKK